MSGTQSIERVINLLRAVASRGRSGMRLGDVAAATGLPTSTCFRMLQRLETEGVLERHPLSRKYQLGSLIYELGLLAFPRFQLAQRCEHTLAALADRTQDTVYLSERRGTEAVCSARALGDYPIKALTLDVGIRWVWGLAAWPSSAPYHQPKLKRSSSVMLSATPSCPSSLPNACVMRWPKRANAALPFSRDRCFLAPQLSALPFPRSPIGPPSASRPSHRA